MNDLGDSALGRPTAWADQYSASLLFALERAAMRESLGLAGPLPFHGVDVWNAYELSWLDATGKPEVAIATFAVPADSPRLVESKSAKLYLTAFNLTRFDSRDEVEAAIARDLRVATGALVEVTLDPPERFAARSHGEFDGTCLDDLAVSVADEITPPPAPPPDAPPVDETLYTRLFRSVCPVTGQPDYASMEIRYRGPRLDRRELLRYLVSFRRHPGFHEHCVERIFVELWRIAQPERLAVHARFTRRGGIDINPFRSSVAEPAPPNLRTARQ